jgi:hypothetical protein
LSNFINLWNDYSRLAHSQIPKEALVALEAVQSKSQWDQFLMKLQPEFESARPGLINRTPVPSLEVCLGELLREEQRLASQLGLAQDAGSSEMVNMAYAAQGRGRSELYLHGKWAHSKTLQEEIMQLLQGGSYH